MIRYGEQSIDDSDIEAVSDVLRSAFLTQGPASEGFEQAISKRVNAKFTVSVTNATSALHLACLALDVGPGDLVWTTPITFVASSNCALYCGAEVDFVDIDIETANISPIKLEQKLFDAAQNGRIPKVLIVVHMAGTPCDMASIAKLAEKYDFRVIEDASHGIGSKFRGEMTGSCIFSDFTVFSFHPVKIITTGEGGAITTNDDGLASRLRALRSHGITREPSRLEEQAHGGWYYEQQCLGYNYRMTELQAALGISQLSKLDTFISRRHILANQYDDYFRDLPISIQTRPSESFSSLHLYIIRLLPEAPISRRQLYDRISSEGIGVNVHYIPVHLQPYYARLGFSKGDYPVSERYYEGALSLPMHPNLTDSQQTLIANILLDALL